MNLRNKLLLSLALLAPTSTAFAAINDDGGDSGPIEDVPGLPVPTIWQKNYNKADYWGSSDWGAGYAIHADVLAVPAFMQFKDHVGAHLSLDTYAKLSGDRYTVFKATASGMTEAKTKTTAALNVYLGSANIYSPSWTSTASALTSFTASKNWSQTFLDKRVPVDVLGIGVTFRARISGSLGLNASGKLTYVGVETASTPTGSASLYASAAIGGEYCVPVLGCVGASAGVFSDVKLIEASVPAKASAQWSVTQQGGRLLSYQGKLDATISTLDGEAGVFAEACLGGCIHKEKTLIDWSGISKTYAIANFSGTHCIAGNCDPIVALP